MISSNKNAQANEKPFKDNLNEKFDFGKDSDNEEGSLADIYPSVIIDIPLSDANQVASKVVKDSEEEIPAIASPKIPPNMKDPLNEIFVLDSDSDEEDNSVVSNPIPSYVASTSATSDEFSLEEDDCDLDESALYGLFVDDGNSDEEEVDPVAKNLLSVSHFKQKKIPEKSESDTAQHLLDFSWR